MEVFFDCSKSSQIFYLETKWNAKAAGTYKHHVTWKHFTSEWQTCINESELHQCYQSYTALEIYILGQVNTLNKIFKLSYSILAKSSTVAGKLFQILTVRLSCSWSTVWLPAWHDLIWETVFTASHFTDTDKPENSTFYRLNLLHAVHVQPSALKHWDLSDCLWKYKQSTLIESKLGMPSPCTT